MISILINVVQQIAIIVEGTRDNKRKVEQIEYIVFTALERDMSHLMDEMIQHHLTSSKLDNYKYKSELNTQFFYHKNMQFGYSKN